LSSLLSVAAATAAAAPVRSGVFQPPQLFFVFAVVHFVAAWMRWRKTLDKPRLDNAADSYAMKPTDDDDDQCVRATAAAFSVLCRTS